MNTIRDAIASALDAIGLRRLAGWIRPLRGGGPGEER
jgi:hypothetical protein